MPSNTQTVDYPSDLKGTRTFVVKAARTWKSWAEQESGKTLVAVHATRAAMHTGFLADGRDASRPSDSITRKDFAGMFSVTGAHVTFWSTLARCLDSGVEVDSPLWAVLCGRKAGRRKEVTEAADKGPEAIAEVLRSLYIDPVTGEKMDKPAGAPRNVDKATEEDATAITVPEDASEAALQAVSMLADALKRVPVEDVESYAAVRKALNALVKREDTLRKTAAKAA